MSTHEQPYADTAQLLEELLLLLTVGHGKLLQTASQTFLDILEDAFFRVICVLFA